MKVSQASKPLGLLPAGGADEFTCGVTSVVSCRWNDSLERLTSWSQLCVTKHSQSYFQTRMNVAIKSLERDCFRQGWSLFLQNNKVPLTLLLLSHHPTLWISRRWPKCLRGRRAAVGCVRWEVCRMGLASSCLPGVLGGTYTMALCALGHF